MIYSTNIYLKRLWLMFILSNFKKRDLSHTHILLIMNHDDKIRDIEDIDDIICAEILDRNIDSILYDIISRNMMHDSYGSAYSDSSCMTNEKYSKKYSWQFCDEMMVNEDDYSIYRRWLWFQVICIGNSWYNNWWQSKFNHSSLVVISITFLFAIKNSIKKILRACSFYRNALISVSLSNVMICSLKRWICRRWIAENRWCNLNLKICQTASGVYR